MTGGTCVLKSLVSVVMDSETYAGGAHPSSAAWSYLFDLDSGEFISPTQFAQDPEGFRRAVADILEEQVEDMDREERAVLWPDYQDTLARWDRAAVQFHPDWLTVRFSPYELGPFALGELAFTVPYDRVTGPLGESGLRKLGISLA